MLHGSLSALTVGVAALCDAVLPLSFALDRALRVPEEEAAKSGLAVDQVRISPKYGGGYPANVEGLHHLHCLVHVVLSPQRVDG